MRKSNLAYCALALAIAQATHASENDIRWNGFITLAGGILQDEPVSDSTRPEDEQAPGRLNYEDRFTGMNDTVFALQASRRLNDKLSITGQIAARGSQSNFTQEVTWAYASYDIDDHSSLRVGRLGLPTFYYSDFIDVGTAYHWITPPSEVYDFQLNYQGINYLRRDSSAKFDFTTEIFAGSYDQFLQRDVGDITTKTRDMVGMSFSTTYDSWLSARLMAMNSSLEYTSTVDFGEQLEPAIGGIPGVDLDQIANAANELVNSDDSATYSYYNLSLKADFDNWFVMTEGFKADGGDLSENHLRRWYLTSGVRFGNLLTHLTFGRAEDECCHYTPLSRAFDLAGLNGVIADRVIKNFAESSATNTKSLTLGVRYDTTRSTAVKTELTKFKHYASSTDETSGLGDNLLLRVAFNASF